MLHTYYTSVGLSCSTQDLQSGMQALSVVACGIFHSKIQTQLQHVGSSSLTRN